MTLMRKKKVEGNEGEDMQRSTGVVRGEHFTDPYDKRPGHWEGE